MPRADVVVVGAGLAGLTCALRLAEGGVRVHVVAAGQATSLWASGPLDVAAPSGCATSREGLTALRAVAGHPYAALADELEPALAWLRERLAAEGLAYEGDLDTPFRPLPTALGLTRPAAIAPAAMAAALEPWRAGERLIVVGFAGFKDLWPAAVAASLRRAAVWDGATQPGSVSAVVVDLPDLAGRRNLNALHLAGLLDDPQGRLRVLDAVARAVDRL
ncbi:MAG TPA: FAD-binding protein, partial [Candidatus Limnocylindrales bacterium]|nr:FAD-binding protein [Candidatus Limnocylindrales bacterium]